VKGLLRRDFLRAVVVVATPGSLVGCGDGDPLGVAPDVPNGPGGSPYFPQSVASGDPRPNSVVLWTRVEDESAAGADLPVVLELSIDEAFAELVPLAGGSSLALTARAGSDGALKVRVENLDPGQTYFYRFTYVRGEERFASRTGRTRTAPHPDADVPVRFAVVSCQDFDGKYFHLLRHAASQELDLVVHLGDYVYETASVGASSSRAVRFRDPDGALALGEGSFAARSLDNYRDLYKTYRSDPDLQRLHELAPFVLVPDDHEFSNDCHGATATYTDGRENEEDLARRRNADQAWFEFMPFDDTVDPTRPLHVEDPFPDDLRIYRAFVFGRHVELVMTDLRRYRPDHLVPEGAFPGSVFLSQAELEAQEGAVPDDAAAYVDVDADEHAALKATLVGLAGEQGFDGARVSGLVSVPWINGVFTTAGEVAPLDESDDSFDRGYAVHQLLKTAEFSALGARYLVAEAPFRALAAQKLAASDGASEAIMGTRQRSWFLDTMKASTRTWKVWGNEYTLMQRVVDLRGLALAPPEFRHRVVLTAEDWDGAPNERDALLRELAELDNVVAFTGDLHALFAATPYPRDDASKRLVEFVCGSISSTTWLTGIQEVIASGEGFPPEAALLAGLVGPLLQSPDTRPNPHIGWLDLQKNGYAMVTASADELAVDLWTMSDGHTRTPPAQLAAELERLVVPVRFRVRSGTRDLEQFLSGEWRVWDRDAQAWQ
jgi:alkaline phosphatase D